MAKAVTIDQPRTELVNWEDELAKEARAAAGLESGSAGSNFFSLRGGILSLNDIAMPDNQIVVSVLDSLHENVYYDKAFDADVLSPPKCFAFARDERDLKPDDVVFALKQEENPTCKDCPKNEWGSANIGRGKACSNRRRIAMLAIGEADRQGHLTQVYDAQHVRTSPIALMKIPVMSVKPFASFVQQVSNVYKRPPWAVIALLKVVPDAKSQFRVLVTALDPAPLELLPILKARREEAIPLLAEPYDLDREGREEKPATPRPGALKGRKARY
jgi:hypothetical protein